jgi:aryl-alcohol dehydrogenase-like predicted oxidoreductase
MYVGGKQEAWTRDAKWQERGLTLATKVYPYQAGVHKPDQLREHFETSLKELGTDTVDIFYLHAPDHSVPFEETLEAVNELHKEGKFVQLGLSNYAAWEVAEIYNIAKERGWIKPSIFQAMYNAISEYTSMIRQCSTNDKQLAQLSPSSSLSVASTRSTSSCTTLWLAVSSLERSSQPILYPTKVASQTRPNTLAQCIATATSRRLHSMHCRLSRG